MREPSARLGVPRRGANVYDTSAAYVSEESFVGKHRQEVILKREMIRRRHQRQDFSITKINSSAGKNAGVF
jgi:hypothetical protein